MPVAPTFRLTLLTLGVDDIARSARFYEALGMQQKMKGLEGVAFFEAGGTVLSLYGRADLVRDSGIPENSIGSGAATLAFNVNSENEVDEALATAEKSGGKILKPGYKVFWGGYTGYFADPDGHVWEVAHNPQARYDDRGQMLLPD